MRDESGGGLMRLQGLGDGPTNPGPHVSRNDDTDDAWEKEAKETEASASEMSRSELEGHYVCAMLNWTGSLNQRDAAEKRARLAEAREAERVSAASTDTSAVAQLEADRSELTRLRAVVEAAREWRRLSPPYEHMDVAGPKEIEKRMEALCAAVDALDAGAITEPDGLAISAAAERAVQRENLG